MRHFIANNAANFAANISIKCRTAKFSVKNRGAQIKQASANLRKMSEKLSFRS
jgi:hypothetical protein